MKRTLFFTTVCLLLTGAVLFSACGGAEPTKAKRCWEQSEQLSYTITLADNTVKQDSGSYVFAKDVEIATDHTDEVKPDNVTGTLTVTYSKDDDNNFVYSTEQTVYLGYTTENFRYISSLPGIDEFCVSDIFPENMHTVKCVTKTSVTFNEKQLPVASTKEINGVYASYNGYSQISKIKMATTYNLDDYTATVTIDDGEPMTHQIELKKGTKFIDANQIAVYARSLEKNDAFQDMPTVSVYEPIGNTIKTAYFANFNKEERVLLKQNDDTCAVLTSLSVCLDGTALQNRLMFIASVPAHLTAENGHCLDTVVLNSADISKLSQVKFTSGYLSYELDFSCLPDGSEVLKAITAK